MKDKDKLRTQVLRALDGENKNIKEVAEETDFHYQTVRKKVHKMIENGDIAIEKESREKILKRKSLIERLFNL